MNRIEEQLKNLNDVRLSDEARLRMRGELLSYASLHSVHAGAGRHVRSPFSALRFRLYAGLASFLAVIAAVGGTAFASESALPGDTLYTVKVSIAEPLQTALVPSDRGKAAWHAILAERRLEETAQLAARGSVPVEAKTKIAANFNTQVAASQESADRLEHQGDTTGSLSVRTDLEARLSAHEHILTVIADHYAIATTTDAHTTHEALTQILSLVTSNQQAVTSGRIALENALSPNAAQDDARASATTTLAMAARPGHIRHLAVRSAPAAQIESAAAARTAEVESILSQHAAILAQFQPEASSTATTTQPANPGATSTTTVSTTPGVQLKHAGSEQVQDATLKDSENMNP